MIRKWCSFLLSFFVVLVGLQSFSALAQSETPALRLQNQSGDIIERLFASPTNTKGWGEDRLGRGVLRRGNSFDLRLPPGNCEFDLMVEFASGGNAELMGQNLCQNNNYVVTRERVIQVGQDLGQTQSVMVRNQGQTVISEIYLAIGDSDDWGDDQLGSEVLRAGQHFEISLPPGNCVFEFRLVFDDRSVLEHNEINLCEQGTVTVGGPFFRSDARPPTGALLPQAQPNGSNVDKFGLPTNPG